MRSSTLFSLLLAVLLSTHGLRKGSLAPSGSAAAFVVGFLMMAGASRVFGVALIGFYLVGSRATKYGKQKKAKLEDGYKEAGYRSGWQVLCNSAAALVAACLWNAVFDEGSVHAAAARAAGVNVRRVLGLKTTVAYDGSWCALERGVGGGWSRALVLASLGHFACCLGDTLASELGILSRGRPWLVTTLRRVPPGTNGAMSVVGTLASVAGGALVGLLVGLTLVTENVACRTTWVGVLSKCVGWGVAAGGLGSLLDSLLGATVQETRYEKEKGIVQTGGRVISGWNVLSNNQVNLASSMFCAVLVSMG